ncbi:MAG: hydrogenase maturation protease [Bacillota bacterium]
MSDAQPYAQARPGPILVATCGNSMGGDDAFGPLVAGALRQRPVRGIEILDLHGNPAQLLDHIEGCRALLLVDAAMGANMRPGQLLDMPWSAARERLHLSARSLSSHDPSLVDQLALAETLGQLPQYARLIVLIIPDAELGRAPRPLLLRRALAAARQIHRHAKLHLTHDASSC